MDALTLRLAAARLEVEKLQDALQRAKGQEALAEKRRDRAQYDRNVAWTGKVRSRLIDAELRVAKLEVQVERSEA